MFGGEVGVLTEQDAQRQLNMWPDDGDTIETANGKIEAIFKFIQHAKEAKAFVIAGEDLKI